SPRHCLSDPAPPLPSKIAAPAKPGRGSQSSGLARLWTIKETVDFTIHVEAAIRRRNKADEVAGRPET
ncbi:hypothetical protein P2D89_14085, partial [Agrobacterium rhizogenes]|uniref:hypothetical protein n=1 Tax=Rhizobium rhizogenes TaxID=359 RepID=UPI00285AE491